MYFHFVYKYTCISDDKLFSKKKSNIAAIQQKKNPKN